MTPQHPKFEGAKKKRRRRDTKKEFKEDKAVSDHESVKSEGEIVVIDKLETSATPSVKKEAESKPYEEIRSDRGRRLSTDIGEESGTEKSDIRFKEISSPTSRSSTTLNEVKLGSFS